MSVVYKWCKSSPVLFLQDPVTVTIRLIYREYKRVTDGARTRDLRSHKWVVGAPGVVEAGLSRVRECPDEGGLQCDCSTHHEGREEAKLDGSPPPSGTSTQELATPLTFRATLSPTGEAAVELVG